MDIVGNWPFCSWEIERADACKLTVVCKWKVGTHKHTINCFLIIRITRELIIVLLKVYRLAVVLRNPKSSLLKCKISKYTEELQRCTVELYLGYSNHRCFHFKYSMVPIVSQDKPPFILFCYSNSTENKLHLDLTSVNLR